MLSWLENFDHWLFILINQRLVLPTLDSYFIWITDLHKTLVFKVLILPVLFAIFFMFHRKQAIKLLLMLLLALGVSDFTGGQVKNLFQRERPENISGLNTIKRSDAGNYSFYSNHSSNMFTFATFTSIIAPPLQVPLFLIAGSVAYSRVYNGVHFPLDVVFGALMGLFWGTLFISISRKLIAPLRVKQ